MNKMFSKAMAANHEKLQHTLRRAAIGAASVGVLLNLISIVYCSKKRGQHSMIDATGFAFLPLGLSLIWNHLVLFKLSKFKNDMAETLLVVADIALFLGFLAIAIANGVVIDNIQSNYDISANNTMLYTYNSVPWLVCSTLHFCTAGMVIVRVLKSGARPKADVTCPDCQRKWHRGDARSKDTAEDSLLAARDYDEDTDGA